jgi:hypothetical protein
LQVRDLWARSKAYKRTFDTPDARVVLADLASFCFLGETTHVVGDRDSSLVAEGRRQVMLRISKMTGLTPAQIESFTIEHEEE